MFEDNPEEYIRRDIEGSGFKQISPFIQSDLYSIIIIIPLISVVIKALTPAQKKVWSLKMIVCYSTSYFASQCWCIEVTKKETDLRVYPLSRS